MAGPRLTLRGGEVRSTIASNIKLQPCAGRRRANRSVVQSPPNLQLADGLHDRASQPPQVGELRLGAIEFNHRLLVLVKASESSGGAVKQAEKANAWAWLGSGQPLRWVCGGQ